MTEAEQEAALELRRQRTQAGWMIGGLVVFLVWLAWFRGDQDKSE